MNGLLLPLFLVQAGPQSMGSVTGIVRGANGTPAPGIRVYAIAVRDATETATAGTALESLAQTDASGRYRLEAMPGRYYIASGSVGSPTYYPGTTNISAARVISIAAGSVVESIDFSSFVPASRTPTGPGVSIPPLPPGSTGVLEGTIRLPDGTAAAGLSVIAVPVSAVTGPTTGGLSISIRSFSTFTGVVIGTGTSTPVVRRTVNGYNIVEARTDSSGSYRLENIPPETYYIVTGYADAPQFFPGTPDILAARTLVTTPTTRLSSLDFVVPLQAVGVPVRGRVTALGGAPAAGATVQIMARTPSSMTFSVFGLPSKNLNASVTVNTDGTFETPRLLPGGYTLEARGMGVRAEPRIVTIADQPVSGLDFSIPVASLSGRILLEDGSVPANPQLFTDAIVTTVNNPNMLVSTVFPISRDGTFARLIEANTYRFYLRNLPDEYTIKSITSGKQDLLKEALKVTATEPTDIEVRVAMRTGPSNTGNVKVLGNAVDSFTGLPTSAERVTLCCLDSGPSERFSTRLRSDGSFEFAGVPRGRYELGLEVGPGQSKLFPIDTRVEVADTPVSGLTFLSTPQLGNLMATIVFENGTPFPPAASTSVVFTGASGRVRVVARHNGDTGYFASVPTGDRYTASVTNLPDGYTVKSISGSADVPRIPPPNTPGFVVVPPVLAPITITIAPSATELPR